MPVLLLWLLLRVGWEGASMLLPFCMGKHD
jgi:hypothetical protein